jgi:hypothetical protein
MNVTGLNFVKMADRWKKYGVSYQNEARRYWLEINKTCLTISIFVLGFVGIFLQIGDISNEPSLNKILIGVGFITQIISIGFGITTVIKMNHFINTAADYYEMLSEKLNKWMLINRKGSGSVEPSEVLENMQLPIWNNNWLTIVQIVTLAIGLLSIFIYFTILLI